MEIRRLASLNDVSGLIRVHGLAWREAYTGLLPDEILQQQTVNPTEEEVQQWNERLRKNQEGILVAVDDEGTVRGFMDLRWGEAKTKEFVGDSEAELRAIYVEPDYWGDGIGTALLEQGIGCLPEGTDVMHLEMLSGNEVGRRFYETHGFDHTDTSELKIGDTAYTTNIYTLYL